MDNTAVVGARGLFKARSDLDVHWTLVLSSLSSMCRVTKDLLGSRLPTPIRSRHRRGV